MGWSGEFLDRLVSTNVKPMFGYQMLGNVAGGGIVPGTVQTRIITEGINVGGQYVSTARWQTTVGAFSFTTLYDKSVAPYLYRGALVALKMGFSDWDPSRWQNIALGQVKNVKRGRKYHEMTVECWDLISGLQNRLSLAADTQNLLYDITTFSTAISSGGYNGGSTMNIDSTTGIQRETGGDGCVLVTADDGSQYFVTYTAIVGGPLRFTGCTAGRFGTAYSATKKGRTVTDSAYIKDHPFDCVKKILTSTGSGTFGASDTLPISWGYGLPEQFVDISGIDLQKNFVTKVSSGAYNWDWNLGAAPLSDPLDRIAADLSDMGAFMAMREGTISVRAAQDPHNARFVIGQSATGGFLVKLDDASITDLISQDAFDPTTSEEFQKVKFLAESPFTDSTTEFSMGSLPGVAEEFTFDLSNRILSNHAAILQEIEGRIGVWKTRIPERLVFEVAPLTWATLTVGDIIIVNTSRIQGRQSLTEDGYVDWPMMVQEVTPMWTQNKVRIALLNLPSNSSLYP